MSVAHKWAKEVNWSLMAINIPCLTALRTTNHRSLESAPASFNLSNVQTPLQVRRLRSHLLATPVGLSHAVLSGPRCVLH